MAGISAVRSALADLLGTIAGLRVYEYVPDTIVLPACVVIPERGTSGTLGRGIDSHDFRLKLVVGRVSESAQEKLDGYLSSSGATSVRALIHASPTLGLAGTAARWTGWENYGEVLWNEQSYVGADVLVSVDTPGN